MTTNTSSMFTVYYIDRFGNAEDRLDFTDLADAQAAFNGISRNFQEGRYGPDVAEIALYDDTNEEMLQTTGA
jgi:hypothetical protein